MMNFKNWLSFFAVVMIFVSWSCQSDITEENISSKETILKTAPLVTYIQRVVLQKTSHDNIIDNSDYFVLKFPYSITINNVQITISSENDYDLVEKIKNANSNDNDIVTIHFPITVIFKDYTEKIINNQANFNSLIASYQIQTDDIKKINCLNFYYPISINSYDSNKQIGSSVTITNDKNFYSFIKSLNENQFIAINYPISIKNSNGQISTITNNSQFENSIKEALDNCSQNVNSTLDFVKIITINSWKISYYYKSGQKTSIYDGFNFTFSSDYKVAAVRSGVTYKGTWSTKVENGAREFRLIFEIDPLKSLDEGWDVFEFNNSQLRFRKGDGNNEPDDLYFEKSN